MTTKKNPLKKSEIEKYHQQLLQLRAQMIGQLNSTASEVQQPDEATGYSQHQADEGTDDFDRTINIELSSTEQAILRQIERALEKIEENTYGICDYTEEMIPRPRLDAMPYACTTVAAQEKIEKGLF